MNIISRINSTIFLALATALAYMLGIAYYNGYVRAIGIDAEMISRNFYDILYFAFFVVVTPVFTWAVYIFTFSIILFYATFFFGDEKILNKPSIKWKAIMFKERISKMNNNKVYLLFKPYMLQIVIVTIPVFILVFSVIYSEKKGMTEGAALLENIKDNQYSQHLLIDLKTNKSSVLLYPVTCGVNNCAGIDINTFKIHYYEKKFKVGEATSFVNITKFIKEQE